MSKIILKTIIDPNCTLDVGIDKEAKEIIECVAQYLVVDSPVDVEDIHVMETSPEMH